MSSTLRLEDGTQARLNILSFQFLARMIAAKTSQAKKADWKLLQLQGNTVEHEGLILGRDHTNGKYDRPYYARLCLRLVSSYRTEVAYTCPGLCGVKPSR